MAQIIIIQVFLMIIGWNKMWLTYFVVALFDSLRIDFRATIFSNFYGGEPPDPPFGCFRC